MAQYLKTIAYPALTCVVLLAACSEGDKDYTVDHFSQANSKQFTTHHLALDLDVDFERQRLHGSARLHMRRLDERAQTVVLDTRDLDIRDVMVSDGHDRPQTATFRLMPRDPVLGQALEIDLPAGVRQAAEFTLEVRYATQPGSTALQWLPPELTAGGGHPLLFSQSQSIHARSWIPLQDTPAVRLTYEAQIRTPPELLALMSADNDPQARRTGTYRFRMPQPIPSYLLAIAVGNFYFAPIGPDTGIYAEPRTLQEAAYEFADTQAMLDATEAVYGPYQWGRYDLLILPPSFPYGGMENPRLSFITPSLLAGDRSLVSVIAHELAHSWSGNLVSNATWRDIWLNEGVTSYLDARLIEMLYGKQRADEERHVSYRELVSQLDTVSPELQALAPDLDSGDPDESQGSVHYAKGQLFLQHLEAVFGRAEFDAFLASFFRHFQWQAITTEQFLDYLDDHLLVPNPGRFSRNQAAEWLYEPGIPADATIPESTSLEQAARAIQAWANGEVSADQLPKSDWSPMAMVQVINSLPPGLDQARLAEVDAALGLSTSTNALVKRAWFTQVAARRFRPAYPHMRRHLEGTGRIYLIAPVYGALADNGEDQELAREIFAGARHRYHPLAVASIGRIVGQP